MTTIFDLALEDFTNEVIDTQPGAAAPGMEDDWCEQTYFYDESVRVKSNRVETLQQRMLSEQFAESCAKQNSRHRVMRVVYWIGFAAAFVAGVAFGVLWIGGVFSTVKGLLYFFMSGAVMIYCMRRIWMTQ